MLGVRDVWKVSFTWKRSFSSQAQLYLHPKLIMVILLDEEELMLASKLLVRDRGMSTIRLACEDN